MTPDVANPAPEGDGAPEADGSLTNPMFGTALRAILEGRRTLPSIEELAVPQEILEAAGVIADASDVLGIETSRLEFLVRTVVWADRLWNRSGPATPAAASTDDR